MEFRTLRADEIEARISTINSNGLSLLLYKDARCDMNLLDETVGAKNWQRHHEVINGNLYCNVGIWRKHPDDNYGEWVWKQDVGTESYSEAEKGQASDAFKRACFNWGIGRELYTAPFIWVNFTDCNITKNNNGKYQCFDRFKVKSIGYTDDRKINALEIVNAKTNRVVYKIGKVAVSSTSKEREKKEEEIKTYATEHESIMKVVKDFNKTNDVARIQQLKEDDFESLYIAVKNKVKSIEKAKEETKSA